MDVNYRSPRHSVFAEDLAVRWFPRFKIELSLIAFVLLSEFAKYVGSICTHCIENRKTEKSPVHSLFTCNCSNVHFSCGRFLFFPPPSFSPYISTFLSSASYLFTNENTVFSLHIALPHVRDQALSSGGL